MGTREASGVLIVSPFLGSGYWGTFIELYTEELHTLCILYSMTIFKKKKNVYSALLLACCWFLAIPPQTLCLSHPVFLSLGLLCSLSLLCSCGWLPCHPLGVASFLSTPSPAASGSLPGHPLPIPCCILMVCLFAFPLPIHFLMNSCGALSREIVQRIVTFWVEEPRKSSW